MFGIFSKLFHRVKPRIEVFNDKGEWVHWKTFPGRDAQNEFDEAVKEVCDLNKTAGKGKYRAIVDDGGLTTIYCSGFYTVPTYRQW
jgi:hypothetical protein